MKKINAVIVMAGKGIRMNLSCNKTLYKINEIPLFMYSVNKLKSLSNLNDLYVVVNSNDIQEVEEILKQNDIKANIVIGGKTRSESVKNALKAMSNNYDVIIHDAARPLTNVVDILTLIDTTDYLNWLDRHSLYIPPLYLLFINFGNTNHRRFCFLWLIIYSFFNIGLCWRNTILSFRYCLYWIGIKRYSNFYRW